MERNSGKHDILRQRCGHIFVFASGLRFWKSAQGSLSVRAQNRLLLQASVPTTGEQ